MRASIVRTSPWEIMVDLFMYRDPEEQDKKDAEGDDQGLIEDKTYEHEESGAKHRWEAQETVGHQPEWNPDGATPSGGAGTGTGTGTGGGGGGAAWTPSGAPSNWQSQETDEPDF